ncbi:hypothetical protein [Dongia sp.]|uniref:hypothetical protein n=1 Tax=Dongia sp. TaxID=1977262 RepID=UPI0037507970
MRGLILAMALLALSSGAAQAVEGQKIDCADTDMALNAPDFEITCEDYSNNTALSSAGKLGVEYLKAVSEKREQFIGVVDRRAIGTIYLLRKGLEEDIRGNFPNEELAEWRATGEPVAGFEYAEYSNRRSGSSEEECIAFRRQMTRRNGGGGDAGFGRIVIGIGCTTGDRAGLIETLKLLEAPGD